MDLRLSLKYTSSRNVFNEMAWEFYHKSTERTVSILRFSFIAALVSEPKISLEEPSFQVETDPPSNDPADSSPSGNGAPSESGAKTDNLSEEILDDNIEPSTLSTDG